MATLKDVAKLACVDVSTVSRALNNTSYVHPDTRVKIMKAVKELSYTPNVLAQGLKKGKRHTIGVVIPRLYFTVFAEIVQGIEEEARRQGYTTLICNTEDDSKIEKECLNRLRNGFVDGIIIAGTGRNRKLIKDIMNDGLAVTQIVRRQDRDISSVIVNYEKCGYDSVKYLVEHGCTQIGLINGSMKLAPYKERYTGYTKAISEFNLLETTTTFEGQVNSMAYGYQCAINLIEKNESLDAIIAAVDAQGIGAMRAIKERNIKVPDDIRLISLTGHIIGGMLETSMTSLEMPAREIGEKSVNVTIAYIDARSDEKPEPQHIVFNSIWHERES